MDFETEMNSPDTVRDPMPLCQNDINEPFRCYGGHF